jgi:hypothetical protein
MRRSRLIAHSRIRSQIRRSNHRMAIRQAKPSLIAATTTRILRRVSHLSMFPLAAQTVHFGLILPLLR